MARPPGNVAAHPVHDSFYIDSRIAKSGGETCTLVLECIVIISAGAGSTWSPPRKRHGLHLEPAGKKTRALVGARQLEVVSRVFCGGTENYLAHQNWPGFLGNPLGIGLARNRTCSITYSHGHSDVLLDFLRPDD